MKTEHAIKFFGSAKKLADSLGISNAAVSQWGQNVPELRALQLERITEGELIAEPTAAEVI